VSPNYCYRGVFGFSLTLLYYELPRNAFFAVGNKEEEEAAAYSEAEKLRKQVSDSRSILILRDSDL